MHMEHDNILKKHALISVLAILLLAFCLTAVCPDTHFSGGGSAEIEDLQNDPDRRYVCENNQNMSVVDLSDNANPDTIEVTYHSNDSQNLSISVSESTYGDYVLLRQTPKDLNWVGDNSSFVGWCENPNGGLHIYSPNTMHGLDTNNLELYAIWYPYFLTVSFETFGGTYIAPIQVEYNCCIVSLPDAPEKYNSVFSGWYLDKEYKNQYFINESIIENTTLYAKWYTYSIDYQVRYEGNDNTGGAAPITSYFESGDVFKIPGPGSLVKDGFTFAGWSYNGTVYQQGASFRMPSKSIHFVAVWEKIPEYTVLYLVDDDQYTSVKVESGKLVEEPTAPTKDGYKFTHWSLNGVEYDFTSAVTSDLELVAEWEKVADPIIDEKNDHGSNKPNWFYMAIAIISIIVAILVYLLYMNKI